MHSCVLVIGGNYDCHLAPFSEELRTTFNDFTPEYREEYENDAIEAVCYSDGRRFTKYEQELNPNFKRDHATFWTKKDDFVLPKGSDLKQIPFKEIYDSFEKFCESWHNDEPDEGGRYGYWYTGEMGLV